MPPKVFISHASEDKDRFVLGFARRLREKGIDAWVDRWEMLPGDSIVDKIFEEGIKNADAVIAVVSANSVAKKWVREELNASVVQRINRGSLLIPVVIDDCEVPEALQSTLWSHVKDLNDYDQEFDRIVSAIFGSRNKPSLGEAPRYTSLTVEQLPGLTTVDSLIVLRACEITLENRHGYIGVADLYQQMKDLDIPEQEFVESIHVLDESHWIDGIKVIGGQIPQFRVRHYGFDQYLRRLYPDYEKVYDQVCLAILNEGLTVNQQIAERLAQPISVVDHIMEDLDSRGLVKAQKFIGGGQQVFNVSPKLSRMFRET